MGAGIGDYRKAAEHRGESVLSTENEAITVPEDGGFPSLKEAAVMPSAPTALGVNLSVEDVGVVLEHAEVPPRSNLLDVVVG